MKTLKTSFLLLALGVALGGCASNLSQAEQLALYQSHAGAPVKDFRYFSSISWTPLGDEALAVWTKPNEAYLLNLTGRCVDLDYAPAISLSNMMGRVSARFDNVYVLGGGGTSSFRMPCRIETIRPLDVKALKVAQKEMREAKLVDRKDKQGG